MIDGIIYECRCLECCVFVNVELYEICLVRARDKLKILQDAGSNSDTDSISSFTGFCLFCSLTTVVVVVVVVVAVVVVVVAVVVAVAAAAAVAVAAVAVPGSGFSALEIR